MHITFTTGISVEQDDCHVEHGYGWPFKRQQIDVYGTGTAKEFDSLITKLNDQERYAFQIKREPSGFGPSDHSTFYAAKIPVFHLFTDLHNDYHRLAMILTKSTTKAFAALVSSVPILHWRLIAPKNHRHLRKLVVVALVVVERNKVPDPILAAFLISAALPKATHFKP